MIESVIFDLDGVIVDTAKYHFEAWKALATKLNIYFDEKINERLKGVSRMDSLEILISNSSYSFQKNEKLKFAEDKNTQYNILLDQLNAKDILPGMVETITMLKEANIKIAIASSSKNANKILDKIGLSSSFDAIITGNDIKATKPNPEVFYLAADKMDVDYKSCLVVEDAEAGIEGAIRAGMMSIGIGKREILSRANFVIENTTDLKQRLENII